MDERFGRSSNLPTWGLGRFCALVDGGKPGSAAAASNVATAFFGGGLVVRAGSCAPDILKLGFFVAQDGIAVVAPFSRNYRHVLHIYGAMPGMMLDKLRNW